jgi:hypothetical protein
MRVGSKVWLYECISVKRDIIINFIIEGISGLLSWFTTVGNCHHVKIDGISRPVGSMSDVKSPPGLFCFFTSQVRVELELA